MSNLRPEDARTKSLTFRRRLRGLILEGRGGKVFAATQVVGSVIWCALLAATTYTVGGTPDWWRPTDIAFGVFVAVSLALQLIANHHPLRFLVSLNAIVDAVCIISVFAPEDPSTRWLRALSLVRAFRLVYVLSLKSDPMLRRLRLLLTMLGLLLYLSAMVELLVEPDAFVDFHTTLYFVICSVFTVGYGDLHPQTSIGRAVTVVVILSSVSIIPLTGFTVAKFVSRKRDPRQLSYVHRRGKPHLVFFAAPSEMAATAAVVDEVEAKYRKQWRVDMQAVIMFERPLSEHELALFRDLTSEPNWVHALVGSALHTTDLVKADLWRAEATILCLQDDHDAVLAHLVMQTAGRTPPPPTIVAASRPETSQLLNTIAPGSSSLAVCRSELGFGLLARSIQTPGLATLVSDLLRTQTECRNSSDPYLRGSAHELYFVALHPSWCGATFVEVACAIYDAFGAIAIGVAREVDGQQALLLNPDRDSVQAADVHMVIAYDASIAAEVREMARGGDECVVLAHGDDDNPSRWLNPGVHRNPGHECGRRRRPACGGWKSPFKWLTQGSNTPAIVAPDAGPRSLEAIAPERLPSVVPAAFGLTVFGALCECVRYGPASRDHQTMREAYHVLDIPRNRKEVTIDHVRPGHEPHVLLFGVTERWVDVIAPLRSRAYGISREAAIVVVTPEPMDNDAWLKIAHFPNVFLAPFPSIVRRRDLTRLDVGGARAVILIAPSRGTTAEGTPSNLKAEYPDAITRDLLITFAVIRTHHAHVQVMIALRSESFLHFAGAPGVRAVASGLALSPTQLVHRALVHVVVNPLVADAIHLLAFGVRRNGGPGPLVKLVDQHSETFGAAFRLLAESGKGLPIAIYRRDAMQGSGFVVHTCPEAATRLEEGDRIYVIAAASE